MTHRFESTVHPMEPGMIGQSWEVRAARDRGMLLAAAYLEVKRLRTQNLCLRITVALLVAAGIMQWLAKAFE